MKNLLKAALVVASISVLIFIADVFLPQPPASAQVPQFINYQGFLTDANKVPINVATSITFTLYNAGNVQKWTETQQVAVNNGVFTAILGTVTPLTLPFDEPYFLGLAVGADPEMSPRQALTTVPYAFRAGCNPGDRMTCYTGATGTDGTGLCATGVRTCNAAGTGWSTCVGEVKPNCGANCVNLTTDVANCGTCGNACANGTPCIAGACGCGAGQIVCGTKPAVCANPATDVNNCGACGIACGTANGTAACTSGVCGIAGCNAGFGNCDNNPGNGCETSLSTISNCGTCGLVCNFANAAPVCASGVCGISACNAGFGNCDNNPGNGCETSLSTISNCGTCGLVCNFANAAPVCASGVCGISACNAGFGNCDNNPANGCETGLNTISNCGTCGLVCNFANAAPVCTAGVCGISACNSGFGNCDSNPANGCETSLNTISNCGTCGHACAVNQTCTAGVCN